MKIKRGIKMKRGFARVGAIALSAVLSFSIMLFPNTADAAQVELTQQDFLAAVDSPGTKTAKGILYEKEGEKESFSLEPGEYKFAENVSLGKSFIKCKGEYVFDLNGKELSNAGLTALLMFDDSNAKVTGNGTIKCEAAGISAIDSNVVIEDTTLDSVLTFLSDKRKADLVINNSKVMNNTFIHGINAVATINSGEFYGGEYGNTSCTVTDKATVIINDGLFESDSCAIEANNKGDLSLPAGKVVINGGTFKSSGTDEDCLGTLAFISVDKVELNGGTFTYEGSKFGPVSTVYERGKDVKEVFNAILGEGCTYSEEPEYVEDSYENITMSWIKQKSISVKKNSANVISVDTETGKAVVYDGVTRSASTVALEVISEGLIFRMYDPNRGEHFYTKNKEEADLIEALGWRHEEGSDFVVVDAKDEDAVPVYRVYNPNAGGMHFYTEDPAEAKGLVDQGWNYEGISHYVYKKTADKGVGQYRLYNPNSPAGEHNWTADIAEWNDLINSGWKDEGVCWKIKE